MAGYDLVTGPNTYFAQLLDRSWVFEGRTLVQRAGMECYAIRPKIFCFRELSARSNGGWIVPLDGGAADDGDCV